MNWKLVLRIYGNLRQLTDDESVLLNTLRAMSDTERELLVESLQPQKLAGRKAAKSRKSGSKSPRATSLSSVIQRTPKTKDDDGSSQPCSYLMGNESCDAVVGDPIHDKSFGYAGYHPFQPPAQSAVLSSTPTNSETGLEDASNAAHAGD